ncbi:hypothetical protein C1N78_04035 [Serratia marcescens]|nr:hypothetical protein C1N78_04035 [Serratia marcescens]
MRCFLHRGVEDNGSGLLGGTARGFYAFLGAPPSVMMWFAAVKKTVRGGSQFYGNAPGGGRGEGII